MYVYQGTFTIDVGKGEGEESLPKYQQNVNIALCEENNEKSNASSSLGALCGEMISDPSRTQIKKKWFLRRPM